jgi:hypothetical protein
VWHAQRRFIGVSHATRGQHDGIGIHAAVRELALAEGIKAQAVAHLAERARGVWEQIAEQIHEPEAVAEVGWMDCGEYRRACVQQSGTVEASAV